MVMRRISGVLREFRRVCPRLFCGGLCMSFIRRAYLHTTSSVLVHRATVSVGLATMRVLPAFPSGVRGLRDFERGLLGVRGALSQALHAACDAHLVPTLRALHYRVPCAFVSAHAPRLVVRVCCVVLRGTHHTLPTRGFFFTDAGSGSGGGGGIGQEGAGVRRSGRKRVARVREEDARMEELLSLCVCWTEMVARSVYS
jgi:hypothetical protein